MLSTSSEDAGLAHDRHALVVCAESLADGGVRNTVMTTCIDHLNKLANTRTSSYSVRMENQ